MPKISIIVPVYNTEKYIKKCINSVLSQEYNDYEIIIINDGSTDNSDKLINEFIAKYPNIIKYYKKENEGVSVARNFGVQKATGDYLCFLDSDDYLSKSLFKDLERYILKDVDLIKYKCIKVDEVGNKLEEVDGPVFGVKTGEEAFNELYSTDVLIDAAWIFLYKRSFYLENKFEFPVDKYHEDWALIPFVLISAKTVISTNIYGYYYVQSLNSITRNNDDEKYKVRAYDFLFHYDNLMEKLETCNFSEKTIENYKIYMTNCLIIRLKDLPEKYHDEYIKEIKKRNIVKNLKSRNIKQLLRKIILKANIKLYLKLK